MSNSTPAGRAALLASAERRRLLVEEHRAAARRVATEVHDGVVETTALEMSRGAAFLTPQQRRGERIKPVRRFEGLEWLATRKPPRISEAMRKSGETWGALWRAATSGPSLRSSLDDRITGRNSDPILTALTAAEWRIHAAHRLRKLSAPLMGHQGLIRALTLICGKGLTPREASPDGHSAARLECLLTVALDLLVEGETRAAQPLPARPQEAN